MFRHGKERLKLDDSVMDIVQKMSDGNPGAITVIMAVLSKGGGIDKADFMGGMGTVLSLDTHGIYGSRIWMLYKDVCNEHLPSMIGILRAYQLGFLKDADLDSLIDGKFKEPSRPFIKDALIKVKERLKGQFDLEGGTPNPFCKEAV
jgi:hypothetical protein